MRLLFDVVMAQNIWIFGFKSDQNHLHTGCVYAYITYRFIYNIRYVHNICTNGISRSGSEVSTFRHFNLPILIHSEASICFK